MTRITGYDLNAGGKLVPKSRKARLSKLPANKQIAARKNETDKQRIGTRAMAQSLPVLERSDDDR